MTLQPRTLHLALIALLAAAGFAINHRGVTIFFDIQIMLGGSLAVFALLRYGRWGIAIGAVAGLATVLLWKHPWAALNHLLELFWLKYFLERLNGGPHRRDNGRVVLADIAFWVVVGIPLETLIYIVALHTDPGNALSVVFKQGVNGVINTSIGLVIYVCVQFLVARRQGPSERAPGRADNPYRGVSVRGASFATVLVAITLPGLLIMGILSDKLKSATLERTRMAMQLYASSAIHTAQAHPQEAAELAAQGGNGLAFEKREADGRLSTSNRALFFRLETQYEPRQPSPTGLDGFDLYVARDELSTLQRTLSGYWVYRYTVPPDTPGAAPAQVSVVQPARELITEMNEQMARSLHLLALLLLIGAIAGEFMGSLFEKQFRSVMAPITQALPDDEVPQGPDTLPMPDLAGSVLRELDAMVQIVNDRSRRVNELTQTLRGANVELQLSKLELERLSITDPLTGCFNRRELVRRLDEEIRRAERLNSELAYLAFDIDHFKHVNDVHGHAMGDEVLRSLADVVRGRLRSTDSFFRTGGEEFSVLLPHCSPEAARRYGELLRASVAEHHSAQQGQSARVTISVGIAHWRPGQDSLERLMNRADQALYAAKDRGRDQVVIHTE
ncbi:GGDEF domain-containing protein [Hydrogenophaga sp. OTU3427]|uniref:GGDEF domain-containing protein n=1 Tax=Hydrogenophaga sp. OTU3427 TaxID=3043856 RepID=UPI00313CD7BE